MVMNRIKDQARYYQNLTLRDRTIKAVVHLEDEEDKVFWDYQLQHAAPATYHYLAYSKNRKGNETHGCEQCLRFKPYLTSTFFVCIDSDLRLLRGEEGLSAENFIAQTYAYSWENHFCEAAHLQKRFEELVPNAEFDFCVFLKGLSKIVYEPLLYLVHYSKSSMLNCQWNITKFNAVLPLQPKREELANNGCAYLNRVKKLFAEALEKIPTPNSIDNEHIDEANAYLHIQGHHLYKLILHIGSMLCHGTRIAFKTDILDSVLHTEGYSEINHLQSDLKQITSAK